MCWEVPSREKRARRSVGDKQSERSQKTASAAYVRDTEYRVEGGKEGPGHLGPLERAQIAPRTKGNHEEC